MTADEIMRDAHKTLRDGLKAEDHNWVRGHLEALHLAGLFNDNERRLWILALQTCPGHEDEGGRDWCAYCGKLSSQPNSGAHE